MYGMLLAPDNPSASFKPRHALLTQQATAGFLSDLYCYPTVLRRIAASGATHHRCSAGEASRNDDRRTGATTRISPSASPTCISMEPSSANWRTQDERAHSGQHLLQPKSNLFASLVNLLDLTPKQSPCVAKAATECRQCTHAGRSRTCRRGNCPCLWHVAGSRPVRD